MADEASTSRTGGALGCGFILAAVFAMIAAIIHANIMDFIIVGAVIGGIIGLFADPGAANDQHEMKSKRNGNATGKRKAREGVVVSRRSAPAAESYERRRDFTRLEVPGGYVPFEMTRTETKTKDTLKTETKIKTYIDAHEVKAVLKGKDVDVLTDGKW